jgi:Zn ribbon nucleic-acid-binding protein
MADGTLSSTGRVYFKAKKAKFWSFAENMVEVRARVCVDCGYVDLYADTSKLKKLVKS